MGTWQSRVACEDCGRTTNEAGASRRGWAVVSIDHMASHKRRLRWVCDECSPAHIEGQLSLLEGPPSDTPERW